MTGQRGVAPLHSLEVVAAAILPPDWTDSVRWLRRRLNRGELRGSKFGHTWMMSDDDVAFLVAKHSNAAVAERVSTSPVPQVVDVGSDVFLNALSERSRSRLKEISA